MIRGPNFMYLKFKYFIIPVILIMLCGIGIRYYKVSSAKASNYYKLEIPADGSRTSITVNAKLKVAIKHLPRLLSESSGLIYYSGGLWTHNDSGGLPQIYKIDTITGEIEQTITLANIENVDWEDITQDAKYIYIGDFGNNSGSRQDLTIYRIEKNKIPSRGDATIRASLILFSYSDQFIFVHGNNHNNYDCEAMISSGDSLYLFSKRWLDHKSMMYVLPKAPGIWVAKKRDSLDAHFLVTGATISHEYNEVSLIGYNKSTPVILLLYNYSGSNFLKGNKKKILFPGQTGSQTEGIAYSFGRNLFISSERTPICPQRIFRFNTTRWVNPSIENGSLAGKKKANEKVSKSLSGFISQKKLHKQYDKKR
jgi:hypothetical protein